MYNTTRNFINELDSRELTYKYDENEDNQIVAIGFDKFTLLCIFSGENGNYFTIFTDYVNCEKEKSLDVIIALNQLNSTYKWAKFYLDKDNDVIIDTDAIIDEETGGDECFELVARFVNIIKDANNDIMRAIYA